MAVEFVSLTAESKEALEAIVKHGQPWRGAEAAFPSATWKPVAKAEEAARLEDTIQFLRQQASRVLPRLEVLGCHYRVGDHCFSIHLRDPVSRAELLLPVTERWVRECQVEGDCSRLERTLQSAARVLDLPATNTD
jgi:hypothetical protein